MTSGRLASGSSWLTRKLALTLPWARIRAITDVRRRVMEAGLAGDLGIVQQGRIEIDLGSVGAAAEEVDGAAAAHQMGSQLPGLRMTDRFDRDIGAAAGGQRLQLRRNERRDCPLTSLHRRPAAGAIQLLLAAPDRDHARTVRILCQLHEHQADRPQADDRERIAGVHVAFIQAAHHAGQRLDQRGVLVSRLAESRRYSSRRCARECE